MAGQMPEVGVNFKAHGLDGVQRGLKLVKDQADPTSRQWGMASRQIASGLEGVARTGKLAGESVKQIISSGAEMAFMFGAGGPIVAAVGILGVAIYEGITSNIKEARAETRKFQEEIAGIRRSGNLASAGDLSQRLFSGDRFAVQQEGEDVRAFEARFLGVQGLRTKVDILKNRPQFGKFGNPNQREDLAEYTRLLKQYEERAARAAAAVRELAAAEGQRLAMMGPGGPQMATNGAAGLGAAPGLPGLRFMRFGADRPNLGRAIGIGAARPEDNPATVSMVEGMKRAGEIAGNGFVDTLASTIEAGIARAFTKGANIGTVFAAIGETALAGLGSIAVQIGRAALTQFAFIKSISAAIASLNPAIGIAAAIGLIAFGSALGGAGRRIGANAGGGGGYGGGGAYGASSGYGSTIIDRGIIDPTRGAGVTAQRPVYVNATFIGTNDPKIKRELQELMRSADGRGDT